MRFLSNLFSRPGYSGAPLQTGKLPPDRLSDALTLMLASPNQPADMGQMVAFMQSARARGMRLNDIRVAMRGPDILYAVLPSVLPGRALMLISGSPQSTAAADAAQILITQVIDQYAEADLCMMQTLVEPHDLTLIGIYETCGFARLAELVYLETQPRHLSWKLPGPDWDLVTYAPETHEDFVQAISESYQGTLDCPGLNGIRSMHDILEGHKGAGDFDPENWLLVRQSGKPAAVLLLTTTPATDALELVYIGLARFARGRGLGTELMKLAVTRTAELSCGRLTTAVDAQNLPAIQMYYRIGMQRVGVRLALIRVIHRAG